MNAADRALRARLAYARRGWETVECHVPAPGGGGCSCPRAARCPSPGKHPRRTWVQGGTADPQAIREQHRRWPEANVAVLTGGERSGLVVVDVDARHGGEATLDALEAERGALPWTLAARTGGGGWHLYFAHPGGGAVRNDAGRRLGPGLDVRGDGGLVLAYPSVHASGDRYRWVDWSVPPAPMPAWLLGLLRPPEPARPTPVPVRLGEGTASRYVHAALVAEAERLRTTGEGDRNNAANRAAFALGQLVGAGLVHAEVVEAVLLEAALAAGLGEAEARGAVASGLAAGRAKPREVA